jgi:predicted nucleic acid-binding protein
MEECSNARPDPKSPKKLAESPEVVKQLDLYEEQVLKIPRMGIEVEAVTLTDFASSLVWRKRVGLLTLDSLVLAVMERRQVRNLASADKGFQQARRMHLFAPADIHLG